MKVTSYALGRPMYYDRNSTVVGGAYYAEVTAHALTTRWTITNTSSQKMFVDSGSISLTRTGVPAGAAISFGTLQSPSGTSIIMCPMFTATLGQSTVVAMGGSVYVPPGGVLEGRTADLSTGGFIQFGVFAHGVQYDV